MKTITSQGRSLFACFLTCEILRFTSDESGHHLQTIQRLGWQPSLFDPRTCRHVHKHWCRFGARTHDRLCAEHSAVCHSATPARLGFFFSMLITHPSKEPKKWYSQVTFTHITLAAGQIAVKKTTCTNQFEFLFAANPSSFSR